MTLNTTDSNSRVQQLAVDCIKADPNRFQSRSALLSDAFDSDLSDVTVFNADFAGLISVWRDPLDGSIYLVDGHRRLDLARRTRTSRVLVQYLFSRTAGEAFGKGILINIAQWVLDSGAKVEMACACRRQALAKAFGERRIDPASEVAEELFEYFPDLKAKYGSPERGV
jgi:hypothetical protein